MQILISRSVFFAQPGSLPAVPTFPAGSVDIVARLVDRGWHPVSFGCRRSRPGDL